ncbi:hypothetical protein EDEG_00460 [Edhazardia aedis USNM 41457]|uniref:Glycerol-3-phosphate dehydrogenase n=1 Tax=Edhazardia aedis (strain USNM 41457) TaxID=1003232 RepID=J9D1F0_EDHAE|nr:hypothetical protein EDEG_00460 [Edhazardia aedis USNM 41457]|eukprot:EJW01404.1 hypothetical protein EDEG_00460 [Edhazardia aedis USNM 41457]
MSNIKKYCVFAAAGCMSGYAIYKYYQKKELKDASKIFQRAPPLNWKPDSRSDQIKNLKTRYFDLLIIGGGSAGCGLALDAATRGLNVALVEREDFGSETSSKSTKLLHGGIRYLEKAFKNFDIAQFRLVKEALRERSTVMKNAPYLTEKIPIMLPVYNKLMVPYFLMGLKFYDCISGLKSLGASYFMDKNRTIKKFPMIKKENLAGSVVYFDGQFNDSRLNVVLALTANFYGATTLNYITVKNIIQENGAVAGAICKDMKTGKEIVVRSKGVINSTGPFIDKIRGMSHKMCKPIVQPSSGVHLIFPGEYAPKNMGLVIPNTKDNSVLFFIPWQGKALVGTTDNKCKLEFSAKPKLHEIDSILNEIKDAVSMPENISRTHILSAWSGIRPLVSDPTKNSGKTENLVRNHLIHVDNSKLITLSGGKWTTYRQMAQETIDKAIEIYKLQPKRKCVTEYVQLLGSHKYSEDLYLKLQRDFQIPINIAEHLAKSYGDRAFKFNELLKGKCKLLSNKYSFLEMEVNYCIENEMALSITDIIGRRMRFGFIDVNEADKSIKKIANLMSKSLKWKPHQKKLEIQNAHNYLLTLGLDINAKNKHH